MSAALLGLAFKARVGSQTAKIVLLKLVDCCDDEGRRIFPSVATLADEAECSPRHAQRVLRLFCAVGLLRIVREGGRGAGSTTCYEMDIDLLAQLRKPGVFAGLQARCALAANDDGAPDGEPETGAGHDENAGECGGGSGGDAEIRVTPCHPAGDGRVTSTTDKGDTMSPNPLRESLKPEREGAGACDAGACAGEREPRHAADAGLGEGGEAGEERVTLDDFRKCWPNVGLDDQARLEAAWAALPFDQRRAAVEGVAPFLAALKAEGRRHPPASFNYLVQRRWALIDRKPERSATAPLYLKPWSDDWWALLLRRINAGQKPGLMLAWAAEGKGLSVSPGEAPGAGEIAALRPYPCDSAELEAWRPWLKARGADLPRFRGTFRVFLPGPEPPGGVVLKAGDL